MSDRDGDAELPNAETHEHHSYSQPTDYSDRNDCFERDTRIGPAGSWF
jgi:hypothetical protein